MALFVAAAATVRARVPLGMTGLLYRNGRFVRELAPGYYRWLDPLRRIELHKVDMTARLAGQFLVEVMSSDRFSFRMLLAPVVTVVDARAYREAAPVGQADQWHPGGPLARLQPVLSGALLSAVSQRTLDQVLLDPSAVLTEVSAALGSALPGSRLDHLLLVSMTLPPEVRKMFTEVERAKRAGLASLERARAEQASLRALANAARTMANNPDLAKLRLWQVVEQAAGQKTFILGDSDRLPRGGTAGD